MTRKRTRSRFTRRSAGRSRSAPVIKITAPAALVGVGTLVVSGVGVADAATGGNFILGKSNTATTLTTLTNSNGTPLSLKAKSGTPPLKVNSSTLVPNLNANLLGGLTSAQLQHRVTGTCTATGIGSVAGSGATVCSRPQEVVFTSSDTFTVPAGVTHITGDLWGGGGGPGYGSGGGGSGAYESVLLTVSPGDVVHVTVGSGGGVGAAGGGTSLSVNAGGTLASAGGGAGGYFPCQAVSGGTPGAVTAPALGLSSRPGIGGNCYAPGGVGFAGAGSPGQNYGGTIGGTGLVILSLDR